MKTKLHFLILLFCASAATRAQTTLISEGFDDFDALTAGNITILSEGFDNVSALPVGGWSTLNTSVPVGTTGWFQGDGTSIPSQSGAPTSCIQANFSNVSGDNTISNWLIAPTRSLQNGDVIKFWTRTATPGTTPYPDRLEVRLSQLGSGSVAPSSPLDVGSYTVLLTEINPMLVPNGYPNDGYRRYTLTVTGLTGPTDCNVAFRYFVTNGGPAGTNSNLISIDTFSITRSGPTSWNLEDAGDIPTIYSWLQTGGSAVGHIAPQAGSPTACIVAFGYNAFDATVNKWLIAPVQQLQNGDLIKFWTRCRGNNPNTPERLEVRLSTVGYASIIPDSISNVGSFSTILTQINPTLNLGSYPTTYTEYTLPISGLSGLTDCRVAFRYFVTGTATVLAGDSVAIDTFSIVRPALANETFNLASKITLSPNPVNDAFQLSFNDDVDTSKLKISICDLNGRMIKSFEKANSYSIADLEAGVYMVKVADGNLFETKRIIKN